MTELVCEPRYWARRLREAPVDQLHQAIFRCPREESQRIEDQHRLLLAQHIQPHQSILDAGGAWGRLLDLLPRNWFGSYLGLDLSPHFIELARRRWPHHNFFVGDLRQPLEKMVGGPQPLDWGVLISVRPMLRRHLGGEEWDRIAANLHKVCRKLLYLEYDVTDPGSVEEGIKEVRDGGL